MPKIGSARHNAIQSGSTRAVRSSFQLKSPSMPAHQNGLRRNRLCGYHYQRNTSISVSGTGGYQRTEEHNRPGSASLVMQRHDVIRDGFRFSPPPLPTRSRLRPGRCERVCSIFCQSIGDRLRKRIGRINNEWPTATIGFQLDSSPGNAFQTSECYRHRSPATDK